MRAHVAGPGLPARGPLHPPADGAGRPGLAGEHARGGELVVWSGDRETVLLQPGPPTDGDPDMWPDFTDGACTGRAGCSRSWAGGSSWFWPPEPVAQPTSHPVAMRRASQTAPIVAADTVPTCLRRRSRSTV